MDHASAVYAVVLWVHRCLPYSQTPKPGTSMQKSETPKRVRLQFETLVGLDRISAVNAVVLWVRGCVPSFRNPTPEPPVQFIIEMAWWTGLAP